MQSIQDFRHDTDGKQSNSFLNPVSICSKGRPATVAIGPLTPANLPMNHLQRKKRKTMRYYSTILRFRRSVRRQTSRSSPRSSVSPSDQKDWDLLGWGILFGPRAPPSRCDIGVLSMFLHDFQANLSASGRRISRLTHLSTRQSATARFSYFHLRSLSTLRFEP